MDGKRYQKINTPAQTSPTNHLRAITTDINSTIPNLSHPPKSSFPNPPASTGAPKIFSPQPQNGNDVDRPRSSFPDFLH
jgi:hypothetical protein